jgi:hypothetical protein
MRTKWLKQRYINFSRASSTKIVEEYRAKYEAISEILEKNPQVISLAHHDWSKRLSESRGGRRSGYTSEQILRALVVMFVENRSYRQTVIQIENSEFLRHFACPFGLGQGGAGPQADDGLHLFEQGVREFVGKDVPGDEPSVEGICGERGQDHGGEAATGHDGVRDEHPLPDGWLVVTGQFSHPGEDLKESATEVPGAWLSSPVSREESEKAVVFHRAEPPQQKQVQKEEGEKCVPDSDRASALDRCGGGGDAGDVGVGESLWEEIGALHSAGQQDHSPDGKSGV